MWKALVQKMSADRKRFFQKVKGVQTPAASHENERLRFLRSRKPSVPTQPSPLVNASPSVGPAVACVPAKPVVACAASAVDFTLVSLKEFAARSKLSGPHAASCSSQPPDRKRPNYDNRLRRLNKKFTVRLAILDWDIS